MDSVVKSGLSITSFTHTRTLTDLSSTVSSSTSASHLVALLNDQDFPDTPQVVAFGRSLYQRVAKIHEVTEDKDVSKKRKALHLTQNTPEKSEFLSTCILRNASRQAYLGKREKQQLELLRQEVHDEEVLFSGMQMSREERESISRKKRILQIAEERMAIEDGADGYAIPEENQDKTALLHGRIKESDLIDWEANQASKGIAETNAPKRIFAQEDYEYVFDESQAINFVKDVTTSFETQGDIEDKRLQARIVESKHRGTSYFLTIRYHN